MGQLSLNMTKLDSNRLTGWLLGHSGRRRGRSGLSRRLKAIGIGATERLGQCTHRHAVLGPAWTRQAGLDRAQVELKQVIELRLNRRIGAEESLSFAIVLN